MTAASLRSSVILFYFFCFFDYRDKGRGHDRTLYGSRKCDLQDLALVVLQICSHHCISLEVKWIPRDLNASADCIGKFVDFGGYGLNDFVFLGLNHLLGPYTIDRFARSYNGELPRLNSRFFQPGC